MKNSTHDENGGEVSLTFRSCRPESGAINIVGESVVIMVIMR